MATNSLCCFRQTSHRPIQPPPALTPALEDLPAIPSYNLDGAICRPLTRSSTPPPPPLLPLPLPLTLPPEDEESDEEIVTNQDIVQPRKQSIALLYRRRAFAVPELDMVAGRRPSSAWQAVAAKVVAANRIRRGLGKEVRIEDFKVEELGGRAGQSVFGPVSTFNGQVTFRVKKPLKGITVAIAFHGVTEMEGQFVNFISASSDLYSGDLIQEGLRCFLFAFEFPHLNLPPTSDLPLISYSFSAKLAVDDRPDSKETLPFSHKTEIMEYRTKPLRISFVPYVDPSLEAPLISRKPSVRKKKSSEKNSPRRPDNRSSYTLCPPGSPGSPKVGSVGGNGAPKFRGPKLTLTTADLPLSASSNSTPVIDKPHPSTLPSAIERTTRITDDHNNTIAKLTIEMPSSRFLPGEEIVMKLILQIRNGLPLPKGLGARVIETRALAGESPDGEALEKEPDHEEEPPLKMKVCGKEHLRVLTGKKFILHHSEAVPIKPENRKSSTKSSSEASPRSAQDTGLDGGRELVEMMTVTLPPFQAFIADSLLPTATLPLGDPRNDSDIPESPTSANPKVAVNGKGKTVDNTNALIAQTRALYFRVQHIMQITIPMGGHHWYSSHHHSKEMEDLEVTVPIILGNKNPKVTHATPEVRLVAPDMGNYYTHNEGSSSYVSTKSNSRVESSVVAAEWREGMKFLTMREAEVRPGFVGDL